MPSRRNTSLTPMPNTASPPPRTLPSEYNGVIAAVIFFTLLWLSPRAAMVVVTVAFVAFVGMLLWSSLRHQGRGWLWGLLFCTLVISIPAWVAAAMHLFVYWSQ